MQPKFLGQKFVVAAFILCVSTAALFLDKITETGWEIISLSVLAGFGGLNLASKFFRPDPRVVDALSGDGEGPADDKSVPGA